MTDQARIYRKDDSFVEIRQHDPDRQAVHARIRALQSRLKDPGLTRHELEIIQIACSDVLDSPATGDVPRFILHAYGCPCEMPDVPTRLLELLDNVQGHGPRLAALKPVVQSYTS